MYQQHLGLTKRLGKQDGFKYPPEMCSTNLIGISDYVYKHCKPWNKMDSELDRPWMAMVSPEVVCRSVSWRNFREEGPVSRLDM